MLFRADKKFKLTVIFGATWAAVMLMGSLAGVGVISPKWCRLSALGFPFPIMAVLFYNIKMVQRLFGEFQTLFLWGHCLLCLAFTWDHLRDERLECMMMYIFTY